jgi:polysaccharide pyruvyl transferase CsaB
MKADRVVLGGGGLLQETTGPLNHVYYLSIVLIAKLLGCRTEAIAMGIDPIRHPWNRFGTRLVIHYALDFISVRDEESRQALADIGVSRPVEIVEDPVFDLKAPATERSDRIGVALSPRRTLPDWPRHAALFCDELSARLNMPMDLLVFFAAEDLALSHEVARRSTAGVRVRVPQQPQDLLQWIPAYRFIISTRFHALVLAAANDIPFVGWGAQPKVAALCRARRQPYFNIDQDWVLRHEVERACNLVNSSEKSVILETRSG